jgi:hypothetical protein
LPVIKTNSPQPLFFRSFWDQFPFAFFLWV